MTPIPPNTSSYQHSFFKSADSELMKIKKSLGKKLSKMLKQRRLKKSRREYWVSQKKSQQD